MTLARDVSRHQRQRGSPFTREPATHGSSTVLAKHGSYVLNTRLIYKVYSKHLIGLALFLRLAPFKDLHHGALHFGA